MDNALRNYKTFPLLQLDNSIFKVNDEFPVQNKEELIIVVVFMPVILALHHTEPHN